MNSFAVCFPNSNFSSVLHTLITNSMLLNFSPNTFSTDYMLDEVITNSVTPSLFSNIIPVEYALPSVTSPTSAV